MLTFWWCPCVESSFVSLKEDVCYDQCVLFAKLYYSLCCFILYSKAKFACYPRWFLTSYFCIPVPYNEKDIFFEVLWVFIEPFSFFSITGWGIDLDYCVIEWFAMEMNSDHSFIFETASKQCISDSFVDHDGYTISSKGQFSSVHSLSCFQFFATPWIAARQASLSITISQSSLKLTSIELVMLATHLIFCRPLLLLPPIPPSIRVFSNESTLHMRWPKYWSFSFSIIPSKEHPGLISFRMDWLDLLAVQGTRKSLLQYHSSKASILHLSIADC